MEKRVVTLKTLSEMYDLNLIQLRKQAGRREIAGLIRRPGERKWRVDLERFDKWYRGHAVEMVGEDA